MEKFHVLPDLTKTIRTFDEELESGYAKDWLKDIERMVLLHRWPEAINLETARTHLVGAASAWYKGRRDEIRTWEEFVTKFKKTFMTETTLTERWNALNQRVQKTNESTQVYFHDKMKLCHDLNLTFAEKKEQLVVGLWSRELCSQLLAKTHEDEDELLQDVRRFERVTLARGGRVPGTRKDEPDKRDKGGNTKTKEE